MKSLASHKVVFWKAKLQVNKPALTKAETFSHKLRRSPHKPLKIIAWTISFDSFTENETAPSAQSINSLAGMILNKKSIECLSDSSQTT